MTRTFKVIIQYFLPVIAVFISASATAQLLAPGSRAVRYTSYPSAPSVKNPVFIYCNSTGTQKGSLTANSPGGAGLYNFTWYKWNNITNNFTDLIKTETGVVTSTISNLDEGGYKVDISGGFTSSLVGWIHLDKPFSSAKLQNRTCDYVALSGRAVADTFYYRDPMNGAPVKLPNGVRFMWSSTPQSTIPYPDFLLNPQTFDPPLVDVVYRIQVTDSFGCVSESSFNYQSIHVKAEFTADPVKGDAPLDVAFTDKSIRGTYRYRWNFGEKDKNGKKIPDWVVNQDSLWIFSSPFYHKYYKPGEYTVTLAVESNLHCVDSFRLPQKIVVEPSKLEIPNVFTPDGDGYNDRFVVASNSLQWINVQIFSRSGMRVYNFFGEGDILDAWQGWDGNVNETSIKASPGVYFYIIKARGWDDVKYDGKEQRGFVYLYR